PVIVGLHGMLSGTSLDGGNWSFGGYAQRSTLPPGAVPILSAGGNTDQVAAFSYGLGAGAIYYATLPFTPLISRSDQLGTTVRTIYTPNLIEYAGSFSASGPPQLLADPRNIENFSGGSATLIVAANGQALQYQWLFNDAPIAGATNTIIALSGINTNQAGSYKVIVSNALASLTSGVAIVTIVQAVPFRITLLGADSSKVVDHNLITGDDRGGIAISRTHVFYTGDEHTGSFVASDLTGGASLPIQYDALVSNLRNGTVYSL